MGRPGRWGGGSDSKRMRETSTWSCELRPPPRNQCPPPVEIRWHLRRSPEDLKKGNGLIEVQSTYPTPAWFLAGSQRCPNSPIVNFSMLAVTAHPCSLPAALGSWLCCLWICLAWTFHTRFSRYLASCDWLLSLSIMFPGSRVPPSGSRPHPFSLLSDSPLCGYATFCPSVP